MNKKRKSRDAWLFRRPSYAKCALYDHLELLKTGPRSKFFKPVKGQERESLGMARGPVVECRECGQRYIYEKVGVGRDAEIRYTPVDQIKRPKWVEDMPAGSDICSGGTMVWALVWKKGGEPKWDVTATMYISWIGGKITPPQP